MELLSHIEKMQEPLEDYIAIDFFGQKISMNYYREHHSLECYRDIEPFYNGVKLPERVNGQPRQLDPAMFELDIKSESRRNPFAVNYKKWYSQDRINNRLPNWFVFHKVEALRDTGVIQANLN